MIRFAFLILFFLAIGLQSRSATYFEVDRAVLRTLDKITGKATDIEVRVGQMVTFGSLELVLRTCHQTPPEEPPESVAFIQIKSSTQQKEDWLFSGWMFSSSPGLNALNHAIYDIWVIECTDDLANTLEEMKINELTSQLDKEDESEEDMTDAE